MARRTLAQWAIDQQGKDLETIIGAVAKYSGILREFTFRPSSDGLANKHKIYTSVPTGNIRNVNEGFVPTSTDKQLKTDDLFVFTDVQSEDPTLCGSTAQSAAQFMNDEMPVFVEGIGQTIAKQFVYGDTSFGGDGTGFKGLRQIAIANGKQIDATGTTANTTSIIAVRMGMNAAYGTFDPKNYDPTNIVMTTLLNEIRGGVPIAQLLVDSTTTGAVLETINMLYKAVLGLTVASTDAVSVYTGIQDDTSDKPTATGMDQLLDLVKADPTNTMILANRTGRRLLYELKHTKLSTYVGDNNFRTAFEAWNGIPLVLEENIVDTETTAIDA